MFLYADINHSESLIPVEICGGGGNTTLLSNSKQLNDSPADPAVKIACVVFNSLADTFKKAQNLSPLTNPVINKSYTGLSLPDQLNPIRYTGLTLRGLLNPICYNLFTLLTLVNPIRYAGLPLLRLVSTICYNLSTSLRLVTLIRYRLSTLLTLVNPICYAGLPLLRLVNPISLVPFIFESSLKPQIN